VKYGAGGGDGAMARRANRNAGVRLGTEAGEIAHRTHRNVCRVCDHVAALSVRPPVLAKRTGRCNIGRGHPDAGLTPR